MKRLARQAAFQLARANLQSPWQDALHAPHLLLLGWSASVGQPIERRARLHFLAGCGGCERQQPLHTDPAARGVFPRRW